MEIKTIYGTISIADQLTQHVFAFPVLERLKKINQSGVAAYVIPQLSSWSRYEHSVGVWTLLKHFNVSLEEQLAGLLHDVSHTAFSHVGELVLGHETHHADSYQDTIHEWFLRAQGVDKALAGQGVALRDVLHKAGAHAALEQDLPDLCADRLDYNLKAGVLCEYISEQDVAMVLNALRFEKGQWFFVDHDVAQKFAMLVLHNNEHIWGAVWNGLIYEWAAQALKRAIALAMISLDELHFSTDDILWNRLLASDDVVIKNLLYKIFHYQDFYRLVATEHDADMVIRPKFRGIDPLVKADDGLQRLSNIDHCFAQAYKRVGDLMMRGWFVKLLV